MIATRKSIFSRRHLCPRLQLGRTWHMSVGLPVHGRPPACALCHRDSHCLPFTTVRLDQKLSP